MTVDWVNRHTTADTHRAMPEMKLHPEDQADVTMRLEEQSSFQSFQSVPTTDILKLFPPISLEALPVCVGIAQLQF